MRQYSESERSSALASFDSDRYRSCGNRSGNCSVHFSDMTETSMRGSASLMVVISTSSNPSGRSMMTPFWNRRSGISGGLFRLAVGAAQIGPVDVGTQVFTADGARCGALDFRTALSGHWPSAGNPLAYGRRRDTYGTRKRGLAASNRTSYENRFFFHVPIIRRRLTICNRNCLMSFKRGKLGIAY